MSTVDAECERSGLPASMCAHCRGLDKEEPPTSGLLVRRFLVAKYPGRCSANSEHQINPGDEIGEAVEESDINTPVGWICHVCVEAIVG